MYNKNVRKPTQRVVLRVDELRDMLVVGIARTSACTVCQKNKNKDELFNQCDTTGDDECFPCNPEHLKSLYIAEKRVR